MTENGNHKEAAHDESIHVEEESINGNGDERVWTEEIKVTAEEIMATIRKLLREATVRHISIRYPDGRTLIDLPLWAGVSGIMLLPMYAGLALAVALVADFSILVTRSEKDPESKVETATA